MRACPQCYATYTVEVDFCGVDGTRLVEVEDDLLLGQVIDRYRVTQVLGRGGMGSVYRATHLTLGRDFALKVLSGELAANRTLIARFHREALALSKIRHSNIVGVVDFVTTDTGLNILIMEALTGLTLAEVIDQGPMDYRRAAPIARQIAAGLNEAHRLGIIHRDVKPGNVFLVQEAREEVVKLLDFGVVALDDDQAAEKLTGHGRILGTPTYMSPEQVSQQPITPASDLYALGIILFEMLTGKPPYEGTGVTDTLLKHVTETAPKLRDAGGLEDLVARLLEKDPAKRPSGAAVVEEITRLERKWVREVPQTGDIPMMSRTATRTASVVIEPPPRKGLRTGVLLVFGALVALITIGLGLELTGEEETTSAVAAIEPPSPTDPSETGSSTISLDTTDMFDDDGKGRDRRRKASPRASESYKDTNLERALAERGLTLADVAEAKSTAELVVRYKKALRRNKGAAASGELVEAVKRLPLDPKILDRRLDRLMSNIRGSRNEIPANLLEEIEQDYFKARAQLGSVSGERAFKEHAQRIGRLEKKLQKLRYGD